MKFINQYYKMLNEFLKMNKVFQNRAEFQSKLQNVKLCVTVSKLQKGVNSDFKN